MHYSFMIVLIAIVIIVGHFTIWRWPPELPTLRRSVVHCTTTYRHDEASRMKNNSWNLKNKQANSTMHYSFMISLIAIVIIVGHFTIWRWPPELPTLRRSVAHCTTTYRHDEASRMMNNSWNLKNKPANPTMLYSFMIVLIVIMKIVGRFTIFTLAAWASYRTSYIVLYHVQAWRSIANDE